MDSKRAIRAHVRERLAGFPADRRRQADHAIVTQLESLVRSWKPSAVLAYLALSDEVDLQRLIMSAAAHAIPVFAPAVSGQTLVFRELEPASDHLTRHRVGMLEPGREAPHWDADGAGRTLVLCPGRAFDLNGNRVGRGGGHYDRFLAEVRARGGRDPHRGGQEGHTESGHDPAGRTGANAKYLVVGVGYELQLVQRIPASIHDQRMEMLVTEERRISTIGS